VAPRDFNTVKPVDETHVFKTGPYDIMRGEVYWYKSIPASLSDLFPTPRTIDDGTGGIPDMLLNGNDQPQAPAAASSFSSSSGLSSQAHLGAPLPPPPLMLPLAPSNKVVSLVMTRVDG